MLLKRVRPKEKAIASDAQGTAGTHQDALAAHEPIISRWSGATSLAFQPGTDFQQYLVG